MKKDGIQKRKRKPKNASNEAQNAAVAAASVGQNHIVTSSGSLSSGLSSSLGPGLSHGSLGSTLSSTLTSGLTSGLTGGLPTGLTGSLTGGLTSGLAGGLTGSLAGGLTSGLTGGLLPSTHHHNHSAGSNSPNAHAHAHHHNALVNTSGGLVGAGGQPLGSIPNLMGGGGGQLSNLNRAALQLSKLDDHLAAVGHQVSSAAAAAAVANNVAASTGNVIIVDSNLHHHYSKLNEVFYPNSAGGAVITNLGMNGARLESVLIPQTPQQMAQHQPQPGDLATLHAATNGQNNQQTGGSGGQQQGTTTADQQLSSHHSPVQVPSPNAPSSATLTRQMNLLPVEQIFSYAPNSTTVKLEAMAFSFLHTSSFAYIFSPWVQPINLII